MSWLNDLIAQINTAAKVSPQVSAQNAWQQAMMPLQGGGIGTAPVLPMPHPGPALAKQPAAAPAKYSGVPAEPGQQVMGVPSMQAQQPAGMPAVPQQFPAQAPMAQANVPMMRRPAPQMAIAPLWARAYGPVQRTMPMIG